MLRLFMKELINKRNVLIVCTFSVIVGFFYSAGFFLDNCMLALGTKGFFILWGKDTLIAGCVSFLLFALVSLLRRSVSKKTAIESKSGSIKLFLGITVFLFLCWLPAFISLLPGVFSYDAWDEWMQVKSGELTSHHPVWHVLLLGGLVEGGYKAFGDYNIGISIYSIIQMLVMAGTFSYIVCYLRKKGMPLYVQILAIVFYVASPVFQLFSGCATKDIYFTCLESMFILVILEFVSHPEECIQNRKGMCKGGLIALGTILGRNNGLYIVALSFLVIGILFRKVLLKNKMNLLLMIAVITVPYFIYTGPVYKALGVKAGGVEEMLSVPLQQMALVHDFKKDSMDETDKEILYRYVDDVSLMYHSMTCVDSIKKDFNREYFQEDKSSFLRLWMKLGVENPMTYLEAFLVNTVDFWYPNAVVNGYGVTSTTNYFDYQVLQPGEAIVIAPKLHSYYQYISSDIRAAKNPFLRFWLSPGWYLLCWLFALCCFLMRKEYRILIVMVPVGIHMLTVLMGPMALVRYVLILYFVFPVLVSLVLFENQKTSQNSEAEPPVNI